MWQNLKLAEDKESVHLMDFPVYSAKLRDENLEFKMASVQKAVSMGHSLRNTFNIKNRQPLLKVELVTKNADEKKVLEEMKDAIAEELNVKTVEFHDHESDLVEYSAKANFKVLGKKLGPKMKAAAAEIQKLSGNDIAKVVDGGKISLSVDGTEVELDSESLVVERKEKENLKVINEGTLTVALDTRITDELKKEGYVRDLIRGIQAIRKEKNLTVQDKINLEISGDGELEAAYKMFSGLVASSTLTENQSWSADIENAQEIEADDRKWKVCVAKA